MITYVYEVAPWCPSNWHEPEVVEVQLDPTETDVATLDEVAIAVVVDEHLPSDRDSWAQLPADIARLAWGPDDDSTVAVFNVTGPRGTYQTRLARVEATDHMNGSE